MMPQTRAKIQPLTLPRRAVSPVARRLSETLRGSTGWALESCPEMSLRLSSYMILPEFLMARPNSRKQSVPSGVVGMG